MLLFAPQAFADGDGGEGHASSYQELLYYIANQYDHVHITNNIQWPSEPVTLELPTTSGYTILAGTVIPENVTVNAYGYAVVTPNGVNRSPVVINGNWNCCATNAMLMGDADPVPLGKGLDRPSGYGNCLAKLTRRCTFLVFYS